MPSLPEALAHGHTLQTCDPKARGVDTFCTRCGAWYVPVSQSADIEKSAEQLPEAAQTLESRSEVRACVCCYITKEKDARALLVTITPQFYANRNGDRLQKMGKGITICMACFGAVARGSALKSLTLGRAVRESLSGCYNAILDAFKIEAQR
jgi:hypothetical protein